MRWLALILLAASLAQAEVPRDAVRYQRDLTRNARMVWGLNAPVAAFAAQIHQESRWNAQARSRVGAAGLAQFMPATATWISGAYRLGDAEPYNPAWAMRAMVTYDRHLFVGVKVYESGCDRFRYALSDYNGGAGRRAKRQALSPEPGNYESTSLINPGISRANQAENEQYPRRIVSHQQIYTAWGPGVCV